MERQAFSRRCITAATASTGTHKLPITFCLGTEVPRRSAGVVRTYVRGMPLVARAQCHVRLEGLRPQLLHIQ